MVFVSLFRFASGWIPSTWLDELQMSKNLIGRKLNGEINWLPKLPVLNNVIGQDLDDEIT